MLLVALVVAPAVAGRGSPVHGGSDRQASVQSEKAEPRAEGEGGSESFPKVGGGMRWDVRWVRLKRCGEVGGR